MTPVLLTLKEAAEYARRHPQTVRQWCKDASNPLPHQRRGKHSSIYIWKDALDQYLGAPSG